MSALFVLYFDDFNDPPISSNVTDSGNQNSTSEGFPKAALDAQNANDLTKANQPTGNNSLGLDVE